MEQKITSPVTKGIVISLILITLSLTIFYLDIDVTNPIKYVGYIILIAGIIWSVASYGKEINYNSSLGNYFSHGFKVTAIVTVFMIVFTVISILLFPEIKEKGIEVARKKMEAQGKLTTEQITNMLSFTKKFFTVYVIGFILVSYLFCGAIASLIGAGVTKKDPHPENDINQIS